MSCLSIRSILLPGLCATFLCSLALETWGQPAAPRSRQFPPGVLRRLEDLPVGRFRARVDSLAPDSRLRALDWLQRFHFTEIDLDSLHVDADGGVYYVDEFTPGDAPADIEPPVISGATVPVNPFPAGLVFHSRPGAPNVLYLNFTGETVTGTAWNSSLGRTTIPAVAFSSDSDFENFSDSEQTVIKRVWQRVAEDYAPFNVDVTTERPASFTTRTANALITRNTDANGDSNPSSSAGGVAYVNVFAGGSYATYRPAWIYYNNLSSSESFIAEAVSHELGHNLGLSHDAKTDGTSYYGGHGSGDISWGPIMGTGYNRNVSQWSKGEYYLANNTEDDLAIIAGKLTYRLDDQGNTRASATPLVLTGGTNVVSTTLEDDPDNNNPANKGVFGPGTDVDVFSFITGSGQISLRVNPWIMPSGTRGGNLDVRLELYDEAGALIMTNNPASNTYATIQTNLTDGLYFLYVRNTGAGNPTSSIPSGFTAYGSLGHYFISGYVRPSGYVAPPQASLQVADIIQNGVGVNPLIVTFTDNLGVDVSTIDGADVQVHGPNGYDRAAQFVSLDDATDGTPRVATYSAEPPSGGVWTTFDNGIYTVWLQTNEVADTEGAWAAASQLGQFTVNVPMVVYAEHLDSNPGWSLQSQWQYGAPAYSGVGPTNGFTGPNILAYNLSGKYPNNLTTAYATSPVIDCSGASSLKLQFQRWLRVRSGDTAAVQVSTNGSTWTSVFTASGNLYDPTWQLVEYPLPDWTADSATVQLRWSMGSGASQNDIGWNIDDIEIQGVAMPVPPTPEFTLTASANNPAWGGVSPMNGTYSSGASVQVSATPATYYQFMYWTGEASGTSNPLTLILNTNLTIQAVFDEVLTTNYPTPIWWLASNGYGQNFESAVTGIGSNGMPVWQSYIAGLNPNDPASQFRLAVTSQAISTVVLHWDAVTGRVYTVYSSSSPIGAFSPIPSAIDLPATITAFTNEVAPSSPASFYRLEVRKP